MGDASQPWTTWLDEHGPALILLARQWAGCHADAEDVVQEAFLRFWPNRGGVRDPVAYLYTCVRRTAIDWLRDKHRRQQRPDAGQDATREPWFEPAGSAQEEEKRAAMEAALEVLPPEQRQVIVMKVWGGLTFAAIGLVLSISPNTAASRYRYALTALRKQVSEALIE
jgi:RNA polymerase sigma-70 factor, ECF subfamily